MRRPFALLLLACTLLLAGAVLAVSSLSGGTPAPGVSASPATLGVPAQPSACPRDPADPPAGWAWAGTGSLVDTANGRSIRVECRARTEAALAGSASDELDRRTELLAGERTYAERALPVAGTPPLEIVAIPDTADPTSFGALSVFDRGDLRLALEVVARSEAALAEALGIAAALIDGRPFPGEAASAGVTIIASEIAFLTPSVAAPADTPLALTFENRDQLVPHGLEIHAGMTGAAPTLFGGEIIDGPASRVFEVPALPAGRYLFACPVHANMIGMITVE